MNHRHSDMQQNGSGRRTAVIAIAAFALCSAVAAVRSRGFLEADAATHYLFARHAFAYPQYFVDVWGRPLCTALFALGARAGGLVGVRLTSLAVAIGCGVVAYALASGQGRRWPALALIFTLGQPLLFLHSFSELTELPFALLAGLALLAYQRKHWGWLAILAAMAPMGRPEGFCFLPLAAVALAAHRQWKWMVVLPMGLVAWDLAGCWLSEPPRGLWWRWLIDHWPYEAGSAYRPGPLLYLVAALPMLTGPLALPAMWIGMARGLGRMGGFFARHEDRMECLIAGGPLVVLVGHSLLSWRGMLSSNGELRYLLVAAPMWGILSGSGWEWIFSRLAWPRPASWAALAVVAPGLINFYWRVIPTPPPWPDAQRLVAWYHGSALREAYPRILTNHPGIYFYMDVSPADGRYVQPWTPEAVDHPPAGVLLLWDPIFAVYNADARRVASLQRVKQSGWIEDVVAERASHVNDEYPPDASWHLFRSPVDAQGQ